MTIYELTDEYRQLLAWAEEEELDEQTLADTLEGLEGEIEVKADGYAKIITQLNADASGVKAEIDRLTLHLRSLEGNAKRMKNVLQYAMTAINKKKFKTQLFSFGIQKNPPKLVIDKDSTDHAPADYIIIQAPIWNKEKLKEDLKAGKDVDGIAHLEQGESLRIR